VNTSHKPGFRELEHQGWMKKADAYDGLFAVVTRQAIPMILDTFGDITRRRLLDVCCGTGHLTAAAAALGANIEGIDFAVDGLAALCRKLYQTYPDLERDMLDRLARTYGTRVSDVLGPVATGEDLGRHFGAGLYQREVEYLMAREWAHSAEDILWRRTKLGLRMGAEEILQLGEWMKNNRPSPIHSVA